VFIGPRAAVVHTHLFHVLPLPAMTSFNPNEPLPGGFPMPGGGLPLPGEGQLPIPGVPFPGGGRPGFPGQPPAEFDPTDVDEVRDLLNRYQPLPDGEGGFELPDYIEDVINRHRRILAPGWWELLPGGRGRGGSGNEDASQTEDSGNDDSGTDAGDGSTGVAATSVATQGSLYSVPSETSALTDNFLQDGNQQLQSVDLVGGPDQLVQQQQMTVQTSSWEDTYAINRVSRASDAGDDLQARQVDIDPNFLPSSQEFAKAGSILEGSDQGETLRGLAGWDILDAKGGDDLVRGGNGRDIIMGGSGADELHGDFGWNTYTDQIDGFSDLIVIKSDQHLNNWWYGTDGNNPNGEKADIIEGLDASDEIRILGVSTDELSFMAATAHGVEGIGIYADGALEAVYTGGNLSAEQVESMTIGDNSEVVMSNQLWSYNFGNEAPAMI